MLEVVESKEPSFVAQCDACGRLSESIGGSRQLAVTRLMLRQWHLVTRNGRTQTLCTRCKATPDDEFAEELPTRPSIKP